MVQISEKIRNNMIKVCKDNKDKFSSISVGRYMSKDEGEFEFALICVKVVPKSICEIVRKSIN